MERKNLFGLAFLLHSACLLPSPGCAVAAQPSSEVKREFLTGQARLPSGGQVQPPEALIGHEVGADYKLARYQKIREYFEHVAKNSGRVNVREIGLTTEGRQMIIAEVTDDAVALSEIRRPRQQQRLVHAQPPGNAFGYRRAV